LELEKLGRRCDIVECDLLDQESVSGAIERCFDAGLEFDILVNCGGITFRVLPEDYPDEKWNEVYNP
jgi:2-dehydro-3-deoxy-D-gluconate 5-dehydrogenase